jgi:hypothetical protein
MGDYVGRYGAALRRLTALETGGLGGLPSAVSPEAPQPAGAFDAAPPAGPGAAPAQGAFDATDAKPMFDGPVSAKDLYSQMPPQAKQALLKQVEQGGVSVDDRFDGLVQSGEIQAPVKKKLTKEEKLGYLAEVALRTISNMSREGTNSSSDWADAVLATDSRRGALEQAEQERTRQQAEIQRREGREDAKETRQVGREESKETRERAAKGAEIATNQEFIAEQNRLNRESEERQAKLRAAQDANRDKKVLIDDGGNMFTLENDGSARPITTPKKTSVTRGSRGKGTTTIEKTVNEQLKAIPRQDASGIDKDTIMREVGARIKALTEDGKLARKLKREGISDVEGEIARRATQQVMEQYGVVSGKQPVTATTPNAGLSAEDQAILAKWAE